MNEEGDEIYLPEGCPATFLGHAARYLLGGCGAYNTYELEAAGILLEKAMEVRKVMEGVPVRCSVSYGRDVVAVLRQSPVYLERGAQCPLCTGKMVTCPRCGCLVHEKDRRGAGCHLCETAQTFF